MISIAKTRELLGRLVVGKTDAEVDAIRHDTYRRVESLVTAFRRRESRRSQKEKGPRVNAGQ